MHTTLQKYRPTLVVVERLPKGGGMVAKRLLEGWQIKCFLRPTFRISGTLIHGVFASFSFRYQRCRYRHILPRVH